MSKLDFKHTFFDSLIDKGSVVSGKMAMNSTNNLNWNEDTKVCVYFMRMHLCIKEIFLRTYSLSFPTIRSFSKSVITNTRVPASGIDRIDITVNIKVPLDYGLCHRYQIINISVIN